MRDRRRLELKPDEYRDEQAAERRQALRELLAILRRAAAEGADWYYDTLGLRERLERRAAPPALTLEPEPEPDPDSPFQPPPLRSSGPAEPERLFT